MKSVTAKKRISKANALQRLIDQHIGSQAECARRLKVGRTALSDALRGTRQDNQSHALLNRVCSLLTETGATPASVKRAGHACLFIKEKAPLVAPSEASTPVPPVATSKRKPKGKGADSMLLAKQTLTPEAKAFFKLERDPFQHDVQEASDVYLSASMRVIRQAIWSAVRFGGMTAIIGESGSGKSTIRRDTEDRIQREKADAIVIAPYVIGMEENDSKGKTLKSAAIVEAVFRAVAPLARPARNLEARYAQMHQLLKASHRSGNKHVLIIEEAHRLPTATLKHLKGFFELEDGYKSLLSIVLIGQTELRLKLSDKDAEVREVVQRCEPFELMPLGPELEAYLTFKFKRVGVALSDVISKDGLSALEARLTVTGARHKPGAATSLVYPLAVQNVLAAAMNKAAELGLPINADLIKLI